MKPTCELCHGTGYYGENGPGQKGNREYVQCDCTKPKDHMNLPGVKLASQAEEGADWMQVVLTGGPPCFHIEGDRFCFRAQRWQGHPVDHNFISLADYAEALRQQAFAAGVQQGWRVGMAEAEGIVCPLECSNEVLVRAAKHVRAVRDAKIKSQ